MLLEAKIEMNNKDVDVEILADGDSIQLNVIIDGLNRHRILLTKELNLSVIEHLSGIVMLEKQLPD